MVDAMLLDLFRGEVTTHLATIELALDQLDAADRELLENVSRAAHAIKGAARIVEVLPAVFVAEAIETLFDAAVAGRVVVTLADTALLARGVETLRELAARSDDQLADAGNGGEVKALAAAIVSLGTLAAAPKREASKIDDTLLELFRVETETHAATLGQELLALEKDPTRAESLQSAMRAAHSIKGASRVVNIELAVALAHVMEDCFVAAQAGRITLAAPDIDALLAGADVLLAISGAADRMDAWAEDNRDRVVALVRILEGVVLGSNKTPGPVAAVAPEKPPPAHATKAAGAGVERVVRVAAANIAQLMNLAGESLVEARRIEPFVKAMHKLVQRQARVADLLGDLRFHLGDLDDRSAGLLETARTHAIGARRSAVELMAELDHYGRRAEDLTERSYRAAISSRMRPFADGVHAFPRLVRDLARKLDKQIELAITGESVGVDRDILEKLEAPLVHLLRNAIDHGLEPVAERVAAGKAPTGTLRLEARHWAGMLTVTVADDGRGVDPARIRARIALRKLADAAVVAGLSDSEVLDYLFAPGFSTTDRVTEISGRGVGLDIVRSVVEEVGGSVRLTSELGKGTSFNLQLPITLSVIRAVVVEIAGEPYAFPMMRIARVLRLPREDIRTLEGRQYFDSEGKNVGLVAGHQVLDLPAPPTTDERVAIVVLSDRAHECGVAVDRFLGEHDLVLRPLDPRLGKVADISAAAVMTDGTPLLVVDVEDMVRSIVRMLQREQLGGVARGTAAQAVRRQRILVVDDSITVREVQRQLLGNRGYDVTVAVDGIDGWHAIRDGEFDLVITDVDMPRMTGIELVTSVKRDPRLRDTPMMIVSYRDREEDRMRGLEAGANYYFTKSDFHDDALLKAVEELIGSPA